MNDEKLAEFREINKKYISNTNFNNKKSIKKNCRSFYNELIEKKFEIPTWQIFKAGFIKSIKLSDNSIKLAKIKAKAKENKVVNNGNVNNR